MTKKSLAEEIREATYHPVVNKTRLDCIVDTILLPFRFSLGLVFALLALGISFGGYGLWVYYLYIWNSHATVDGGFAYEGFVFLLIFTIPLLPLSVGFGLVIVNYIVGPLWGVPPDSLNRRGGCDEVG